MKMRNVHAPSHVNCKLDLSSGSPNCLSPGHPPGPWPSCFEEPALPFQLVPGVKGDILLFLSFALRELAQCTSIHGWDTQGGQRRGWGQAGVIQRKRKRS